jgi:dipeptidyl aminopeptidase/acylaminoacyl peptidase
MTTESRSISSKDFAQLRFAEAPALSFDGKLIFTIRATNEKENNYKGALYYKSKESDECVQYSAGTHLDTMAQFSPSGKLVAFLSSRSESGMQVYVMNVDGGEAVKVTNFPKGVVGFTWSHDNNSLHVLARVNETELESVVKPKEQKSYVTDPIGFQRDKASKEQKKILVQDPRVIKDGYYREGTSYLEGRTAQPFILSIAGFNKDSTPNKKFTVTHLGNIKFHYSLGVFTIDNSRIVLSKYVDDPSITLTKEIISISTVNRSDIRVLGKAFGWVSDFQISPEGEHVSFSAKREEIGVYDDEQIFLINIKEESSTGIRCITTKLHRSATFSRWLDNQTLIFLSPSNGRISINSLNVKTESVNEVVGGERNINSFAIAANTGDVAFEVSHSSFPSDIFLTNLSTKIEKRVTKVNQSYLTSHPPARVESYEFQRDGFKFQGWIFMPSLMKDKIPVVLEIHGGPAAMWSPHEKTMWHEWNAIVGRGNAVVFCNPRGSDGYGIEFRGAVFENWGKLPADDILKSLDTAIELFPELDNERISVTGGSYGGYMTAWLISQTNRFKAAISQRGVYEFIAFGMTTDIPVWFERQYGELIEQYSRNWSDAPLTHVKNMNTPLLIIHSENDFRVPIVNAEQLFWMGKRYGKTMELVRYPRDGHELSRSGEPRHIIDRITRIIDWIEKYSQ